jgi:hypothetical protein
VKGVLEVETDDFVLNVQYLYILGGRLIIGWDEEHPYLGLARIYLRGFLDVPNTQGIQVGVKAIGMLYTCTKKVTDSVIYTQINYLVTWLVVANYKAFRALHMTTPGVVWGD